MGRCLGLHDVLDTQDMQLVQVEHTVSIALVGREPGGTVVEFGQRITRNLKYTPAWKGKDIRRDYRVC